MYSVPTQLTESGVSFPLPASGPADSLQGEANAVSQPLSENTAVRHFRALVRHGAHDRVDQLRFDDATYANIAASSATLHSASREWEALAPSTNDVSPSNTQRTGDRNPEHVTR